MLFVESVCLYLLKQGRGFMSEVKYLKKSDSNSKVNKIIKYMKTQSLQNTKLDCEYSGFGAINLLRSVSSGNIDKGTQSVNKDILTAVCDVIEDWTKKIPIDNVNNPIGFNFLMNQMTRIITSLIKDPQRNLNQNQNYQIQDKIIFFLLEFSLELEHKNISELQISKIADYLAEAIKNNNFNRQNETTLFTGRNASVYGVTLKNTTNSKRDDSIHNNVSQRETNAGNATNNATRNENVEKSESIVPKSEKTEPRHENLKDSVFEKYQKIIKEKISELPIYSTPETAELVELAKTGLFNGILKTFFRLKSDPELENDYGYFEMILEDKIDEMLDLLPQTEEMKVIRHGWKVGVLAQVMDMLKELQQITDRPCFRQRLKDGFNRRFAKKFELDQCFLMQQGFLVEMADAYILICKYNEEDAFKANIYKHRLMKKVEELVNHITSGHNKNFQSLNKPQLVQYVMKALESVPTPGNDILNEEVEELHLAEEIENWYKELPISPYINDLDRVFRKRMIALLAKKLYDLDKNTDELDSSKERLMKHEMSNFLTERGRLEPNQDLNINFMVDELENRLKIRRINNYTDMFENNKPLSSTLANINNTNFLAPLLDAPKQHSLVESGLVGHKTTEFSQNDNIHNNASPSKRHNVNPVTYSPPLPSANCNLPYTDNVMTSQNLHPLDVSPQIAVNGVIQSEVNLNFANQPYHPIKNNEENIVQVSDPRMKKSTKRGRDRTVKKCKCMERLRNKRICVNCF